MFRYILLFSSVASLAVGQLLLKKGVPVLTGFWSFFTKIFTNAYLFFGLLFFVVGFFLWLFVLQHFRLSVVYPVSTSLAFLLVMLLSAIFLKEQLQPIQMIGVVVILFGIFLLSR